MGNSTYFGNKTPRLPHLVTPGGLSGEVLDVRNDIDEAFVDIETALGSSIVPPTHQRYVDINASSGGNGTQSKPYTTIQEAVDDLEAVNDSLAKVIYIQPGLYPEAVVIRKDYISLLSAVPITYGDDRASVQITPADDQWPLTLTNATLESLAAYDLSGDYGDLVNQGDAGPKWNVFMGLSVRTSTATVGAMRLLGVKGDASPNTTDFGEALRFQNCRIRYTGSHPYAIVARNAGEIVSYNNNWLGKIKWENSYRIWYHFCEAPQIDVVYDELDPHGTTETGTGYSAILLTCSAMEGPASGSSFDNSASSLPNFFWAYNSIIGYRESIHTGSKKTITVKNGWVRLMGSTCLSHLDLDGDTEFQAEASDFDCNIILGSGPGVAYMFGGGWSRELTDPDNKLVFTPTRKFTYPASTTTTVTAVTGQRIRYNTSGGTFQIDAPASPNTGDSFAVKEIVGDATNVTVDGNGNNIEHPVTGVVASSAVFGVARIGVTWEFDGTDWIIP